ncbi:MAG TPA: prolipoprotein diacylglyceryl transferase family protein [Candidatus Limnocylindria bacterium]|nr:prolipoprotein diacylglyceryl transferase family protein [Candidatus Limnocylindria bacterium]
MHFGPFQLAWHGIFTAVGIFFGVWLPVRVLRGRVGEDALYAVATPAVIGGIIGARLFHVAECWTVCGADLAPGYSAHPELIPQIWSGGISIMGALVVGVVTGYIVAIRRGDIPIGATADAAAPGIGLGMAIGRIGDIINGEHHALPCAPPGICVGYDNPSTLGQPGPVHLAVGYEMLWDLAGIALALLLRRALAGRVPEGRIFWIWLAFQSLGRFLISFLRVDQPGLFGLYQAQLISIILIALAIPMVVSLSRMARAARATPA